MTEILYRKWRPRRFAELAGQEHVATTLTNALANGRVAHAYLFAGSRGTGKTSTGRLLAKALNCGDRQAGEPCNRCESCLSYLASRAMDLVELDAASNRGIDEIRSLREKVAFAPGAGEFKVYLIDEVHMLTEAAFTALLKTLEEPPPHVVFVLATTETHKVPATIVSRCQRFDFRRPPLASIVGNLERICEGEGFACEPAALELIARSATGSHRDAVNLLDQLVTSYGSTLSVEHVKTGLGLIGDERAARLARLTLAGDLAGGLETIGAVRDDGLDLRQFQRELVDELRNLLLVKSGIEPADGVTAEHRRELAAAVASVPTAELLTALRAFGEADLKADPNSTLPLDIALAECVLGRAGQTGPRAVRQDAEPDLGATLAVDRRERSGTSHAHRPSQRSSGAEGGPESGSAEGAAPLPRGQAKAVMRSAAEQTARDAQPSDRPAVADANGPGLTLAAAREKMRAIFNEAQTPQMRAKVSVGALLNGPCDIIDADEVAVTFGFKHDNHAQRMRESENLKALTSIVTEIMGREFEVRCVYDENVDSWKQRETASRSPLVRAAQELGARVVAAEPEEQT